MSRMNAKNLLRFEEIMLALQDLNSEKDEHVSAFLVAMNSQLKRDISETAKVNALCITKSYMSSRD